MDASGLLFDKCILKQSRKLENMWRQKLLNTENRVMDNLKKRNATFLTIGLIFLLSGIEYGKFI